MPVPDISSGRVPLPRGVFMRSPNPNQVDRGIIQQWNVAYEYRLPWDIAAEVAYVGTATDGGYADLDLNYGVPGRRQRLAAVLRARRHHRQSSTGRRGPRAATTACRSR